MKVSVLIPTYNSALTIGAAVDSVLSQSVPPDEILVMDDGSTDETVALLAHYGSRLTVLQQPNQGVARARNVLCRHATGELIAFLDHDDLWHPDYLAAQQEHFRTYPQGVAFFTGHDNFNGYGGYQWPTPPTLISSGVEVIAPLDFLDRYHKAPGSFASMSYCCIPRKVLNQLGTSPFCAEVSGVDDYHLMHQLLLLGSIVLDPRPLAAYRITPGAQSASLLKGVGKAIRALELLEPHFDRQPDARLRKLFQAAFSAQRREFGKILMGAAQTGKAREQLRLSLTHCHHLKSLLKSMGLLFLTVFPDRFQPKWPADRKLSHST
jgi:glycosyltransferase involved in cell wall biosynthesis